MKRRPRDRYAEAFYKLADAPNCRLGVNRAKGAPPQDAVIARRLPELANMGLAKRYIAGVYTLSPRGALLAKHIAEGDGFSNGISRHERLRQLIDSRFPRDKGNYYQPDWGPIWEPDQGPLFAGSGDTPEPDPNKQAWLLVTGGERAQSFTGTEALARLAAERHAATSADVGPVHLYRRVGVVVASVTSTWTESP